MKMAEDIKIENGDSEVSENSEASANDDQQQPEAVAEAAAPENEEAEATAAPEAEAAPVAKAPKTKKAKAEKANDDAAPAEREAASEPAATEPPKNPNMKWYIVHSYSGFERKVKESLESRVAAFGLQDKIGRVVIPTEPVTEIRNGKKYTIERAFLPGYVLVEMDLTGFRAGGEGDHVWHVVKSTPRVTGFVGTGNDPTPLSEEEVNTIVYRVNVGKDKPKLRVKFEKNESVKITEGPFANFTGIVDEVNEDRATLKIMVTIFGRATPVELEFGQVEKVA
jgi:transcriptional antiterminator NusG